MQEVEAECRRVPPNEGDLASMMISESSGKNERCLAILSKLSQLVLLQ